MLISRRISSIFGAKAFTALKLIAQIVFPFGRKTHYGTFGEDAMLSGYFMIQGRIPRFGQPVRWLMGDRTDYGSGFYVDVGANEPKLSSNTYWAYRKGWRGINIEPTEGSERAFGLVRPRDKTVEVAIAESDGVAEFYSWSSLPTRNTLVESRLDGTADYVGEQPEVRMVETRRLESVLDEHLPDGMKIDFLNVDAEGFDLIALQSNNWEKHRPELVIVEDHENHVVTDSSAGGEEWKPPFSLPTVQYLQSVGYELYGWLSPSVIMRDGRIAEQSVE